MGWGGTGRLRDPNPNFNPTPNHPIRYTFLLSWILIYVFAIIGMRVFGGEVYFDDTRDKDMAGDHRTPFNFDSFAMSFYTCWFAVNALSVDVILDDVVHNR